MIGILGGTFDPIHYGHLRPAHDVMRRLGLRRLHLVPAANPPHRAMPVATAAQRLHMVELAVPEFPGFLADAREIERGGPSYTVLTLASLRAEHRDEPLCLLVGADAFVTLPAWHRWTELFELAHIVVMTRPAAPLPAQPPWARERMAHDAGVLAERRAGAVFVVAVTPLAVSASALRAAIARGVVPAAGELPPPVWDYIRDQGLYRSPSL